MTYKKHTIPTNINDLEPSITTELAGSYGGGEAKCIKVVINLETKTIIYNVWDDNKLVLSSPDYTAAAKKYNSL